MPKTNVDLLTKIEIICSIPDVSGPARRTAILLLSAMDLTADPLGQAINEMNERSEQVGSLLFSDVSTIIGILSKADARKVSPLAVDILVCLNKAFNPLDMDAAREELEDLPLACLDDETTAPELPATIDVLRSSEDRLISASVLAAVLRELVAVLVEASSSPSSPPMKEAVEQYRHLLSTQIVIHMEDVELDKKNDKHDEE